jgi:acyl-[acyl-carrier protein] desaturase
VQASNRWGDALPTAANDPSDAASRRSGRAKFEWRRTGVAEKAKTQYYVRMTTPEIETLAKVEVLADLEETVHELMEVHEAKRVLWFPSELLAPAPDTDPDRYIRELRDRARGISTAGRVALALNLLTEEGLPHFHRLLAVYLGNDSFWSRWTNLWTAEEDRHGAVLHDYTRDSQILDSPVLEKMQFEYLKAGFEPAWDKDPYRVFVYTTLQERATQVSHANTGKLASESEPTIGTVLANVAKEEARHYAFYREIFKGVLQRDPNGALQSAATVMPSIDMPGVNMPHFREMADVIRRAGIYGPRDYLRIVEEQIRYWAIDVVDGLNELGKKAQEKIVDIPARLERVADAMESRSRAKTFSFAVAFAREFTME